MAMRLPTFSRVMSLEDARALGVERQVHGRFLVWPVEAGLGVGQAVAGQDDLLLDEQRLAAALQVALGAEGHRGPVPARLRAPRAVVDHAHFQRGGAAEDVLGLGGVLHAGQLHHDAVGALLLDHRLGHAQFVDPVVQRGDVLLERLLLHAAGLGLERARQLEVVAVGRGVQSAGRELVGDQVARAVCGWRRRGTLISGCLRG
jgi:hypothetical protein